MSINRENYEVWFIDYLDGKLDEEAREKLYTFLDQHSDLAEELQAFEEIEIKPANIKYSQKPELQKSIADIMRLDPADFLLVKQMEEGLTTEEEQQLAAAIADDETLISRGNEFRFTRLKPGRVICPRKPAMLRQKTKPLYFYFSRIGIAASIMALVYMGWDFSGSLNTGVEEQKMISQLEPRKSSSFENEEIPLFLVDNSSSEQEDEKVPEVSVIPENRSNILSNKEKDAPEIEDLPAEKFEMAFLTPKGTVKTDLEAEEIPNAYETGLRQMMPLYLELNNREGQALLAYDNKRKQGNGGIFTRGLEMVDKIGGDLVNFDKEFDEEGNFVAFNFRTGLLEVEQKIRR